MNNIKLTSSRDFRLNLHKLQDMLTRQNGSDVSENLVYLIILKIFFFLIFSLVLII